MAGAAIFTAVVITVLVLGTYLLQAAILVLQVALWLAARVVAPVLGAAVWCVWWVFDRREAMAALERADAQRRC